MTSGKISASLREIREEWSLLDLLDAHITLDMLEDAEAQANAR